jgi:hypothetical protein
VATLLSVVTEEPPRLKSVMQGVPPALDEAVAYALTSDVNNRCPSAEAFRCMLESAWDECGGMASPAELGAFVRQTVGQRLAERRAMVARGRTGPVAVAVAASSGSGPALLLARPESRAPEDGTKTAISAAVPAAESVNVWRAARNNRRSLGLAALLLVSVAGAAAPAGPHTTNPVSIDEVAATAPARLAEDDIAGRSTPARGADDAPGAQAGQASATEPVTQRSSKRGARSKATQRKPKTKAVARGTSRDNAGRTQKAASTSPRPLPQSPDRQSREKAPEPARGREAPAAPKLAPDPYDSNR